ncbi:efflux RND transporter permease subunit [Calidifontibacillus erzurumensis]|uniref:Efflux RND transporter permease subunit n=1 Tax=Calidifontibacillus erzurumensis TaxID=2741433 RepID=A0A8J8GEX0_9BACI|nr:efflux RND transporter permease subunit [Calidifontibacillus erzurumensis]NSL51005.1 efflux RND transporter permease subunit [Calidifontibacillus erzurumensis]
MNLSDFSIRRPVTVLMVIISMVIFGFISFPKMAVDLLPEMNLPVAVVATSVDGGTPEEVEKLVTKPIEEALASIANVDSIQSSSVSGSSLVIVMFNWGTDINQATLDMRDKVDLIEGILPDSANDPKILKFDPNSEPVMTLALYGRENVAELKGIADNLIKTNLERIDGVASVGISGGRDRVITITADPNKLEMYGITFDQIRQSIAATNLSGSAGAVKEGDEKLQIRVQGEYGSVKEIGDTPIIISGGSIALKNIAVIEDTYEDVTHLAYLNGKPSLGISITKATGGNTVEVAEAVYKEMELIKEKLPKGIELAVIMDTSEYIKDSINTVAEHALLGLIFAVLILYFFLNSARSTLVVSIVIPISIIATFTLMYFTGQTINLISLSGLLLGLGSLVDFAVVIMENIFRKRQEGKGMLEAALEGSKQVKNAVMASALAQIVVFLPIVFVDGIAAELFGPLALTVIFSHIAALVVSLMIVPMLSSRWLDKMPDEESFHIEGYKGINPVKWFQIGFGKIANGYGRLLKWALHKRKTVLLSTIAMLGGAVILFPFVGMEFMPKMDEGQISISVEMPNGTVLEETEKTVTQIEKIVKKVPELEHMYTSIGSDGGPGVFGSSSSNIANISIKLVDISERSRSTEEIANEIRPQLDFLPDAKITVSEVSTSHGMAGSPIQINLRGDDLDVLKDIADILAAEIEKVEGTNNVKTSLEATKQEFQIVIDQKRASEFGLTTSQVLSAVRIAFDGQTVTSFRTGDDEIDVKLQLPRNLQGDKTYLEKIRITTPQGGTVALSSVAKIVKKDVPQMITRNNQTREVQITSDVSGRDLASISKEIQERINTINLPDGYSVDMGGQSQEMMESFVQLGLAMLLSIILVYMVMAGQFESLFTPFVIMFSIPPTFIGVVIGLLLTGKTMSVMAIIGYILLIGIVVNNAIVLIDYVIQLRKEGMDRDEAVLKAGPIRLRPILMTTLATILAILPLAFGGGAGNESQAPMAIVVAFGLSFSTLITLVLIPVVYCWFDDIGKKRKQKKIEKLAKKGKAITQSV